jgi:hypothetical protein
MHQTTGVVGTRYSAPVSRAEADLVSPIAIEIIGNLTAKVHKTGDEEGDFQRRKASIKPPSTVITWPVVLLSRFVSNT